MTGTNHHLFEDKLARLRARMRDHNLSAVLLMKNDNTRYVTGYQRYYTSTYLPAVHAVVVTHDRGPFLLVGTRFHRYAARFFSEEVLPFSVEVGQQSEALARLIETCGLSAERIGIEADFMPVDLHAALSSALPRAHLADARPCLEATVSVKFEEEIELIREACRYADAGIAAIAADAKAGMTEREIAALAAAGLSEGAEYFSHLCVRSGPNSFDIAQVNTDRRVERNDLITLDIGYIHEGYVSDINRTLLVGRPSDEQVEVMRLVIEMERASIAALIPGTTASEVYGVATEIVMRSPYAAYWDRPFNGHSIGVSLHENPYITPQNDGVLETNMVIAMEPGLSVAGRAACRTEDIVVIRPDGPEFLTHSPDDLTLNGIR